MKGERERRYERRARHRRMHVGVMSHAGLACGLLILTLSAAPSFAATAMRSHAIDQFLDKVGRDPALQSAPVTLILESDPRQFPETLLKTHGGKLRFRHGRLHEISIPGGRLAALLLELPSGVLARFPYPVQAAIVTGQGVALTGASDMQALGDDGAGVTIGIIDLGFANLSTSQSRGELPANLTVTDYTGTGTGGMDHGTNVAEIVHEMAPGAALRLAKIATETQFSQAVSDMRAAGVRVINHSAVWFAAGGFYDGTGPICDIVNAAGDAGILWVNAMGNHRYKHYLGTFTDSDGDLRHEFAPGQNYDSVNLTAGSRVQFHLNWDAYPQTTVDYNLYLYQGNPDSGGVLVISSLNAQSGKGRDWYYEPYEGIDYTPTTSGTYYLVVRKTTSGTANVRLTLFSTGPDLITRTTASSILQPADCANVIGVGATDLNDNAEYFSSEGPTTDGRPKPEVTGPNRVQTSWTTSFAGTSAATPHVAGAVAALVSQAPTLTRVQIQARLTTMVKDVNPVGYDYRTGYGRISLDADLDGINHDRDNCRLVANLDQADTDADGQGNACDADDDNDGLVDALELAIGTNPLLADTDGDGLSDYAEVAYDGDASRYTAGVDLNPLSRDTDGDGLPDNGDVLPLTYNYGDGDVAPAGAPDRVLDAADLAVMQQIVLGTRIPTVLDVAHGDVYPPGAPDGRIDMSDLIVLLSRLR